MAKEQQEESSGILADADLAAYCPDLAIWHYEERNLATEYRARAGEAIPDWKPYEGGREREHGAVRPLRHSSFFTKPT